MNSSEVKAAVTAAFRGVSLDGGCSLRQGEKADNWGEPAVGDPGAFPEADVADDWLALSMETLDHYPYLAYMDAEGFRYYIPAFTLSVLAAYETSSMRVICTLSALYPKKDDRDYHMGLYSLLNREQRMVIARYLHDLPTLVELAPDDQKVIERALRNYWHEFL